MATNKKSDSKTSKPQAGRRLLKAMVAQLATEPRSKVPGKARFSAIYMWRTKWFFGDYRVGAVLAPLVRVRSWTQHLLGQANFDQSPTPALWARAKLPVKNRLPSSDVTARLVDSI